MKVVDGVLRSAWFAPAAAVVLHLKKADDGDGLKPLSLLLIRTLMKTVDDVRSLMLGQNWLMMHEEEMLSVVIMMEVAVAMVLYWMADSRSLNYVLQHHHRLLLLLQYQHINLFISLSNCYIQRKL